MIKDPKEKETIARAAYTSVKDEDKLRQWPLAAYELARCYAQRGVADTNLLKPYIDVQLNLEYHKQKMDDFGNASWQGWYNDEAIVTSHIKMLANAGAFASAYRVAEMLLPDGKPEYRRLKNVPSLPELRMERPGGHGYRIKLLILEQNRHIGGAGRPGMLGHCALHAGRCHTSRPRRPKGALPQGTATL